MTKQHTLNDLKSRITRADLLKAKQHGFSDRQLAHLWQSDEWAIRALRKELGVAPVFKTVDKCAADFKPIHRITIQPMKQTTKPSAPTAKKS